jgi:hypothetical protein
LLVYTVIVAQARQLQELEEQLNAPAKPEPHRRALAATPGSARQPTGDGTGGADSRRLRLPNESDGVGSEELHERLAAKSVAMEKLEAVRWRRCARCSATVGRQ